MAVIQRLHDRPLTRWLANIAIIVAAVALGATALLLYQRFESSNARFHKQLDTNYRIDHATDRLNCALRQIIVTGGATLDDPRSPTYRLYVRLGFTLHQIQDASAFLHEEAARQLHTLPLVSCGSRTNARDGVPTH